MFTKREVNSKLPSDKVLLKKKQIVKKLADKLANAVAGVVIDYKGVNVQDDTRLRVELRLARVDYFVAKNTLLKLAAKSAGLEGFEEIFKGTTSVAISADDYIASAKIVAKYSKELNDKFNIKAGFVDGKLIDAKTVEMFANLPPKKELVAMALRGLSAPLTGLASALSANIRNFVVVLGRVAEQKSA
jgi:large subunit ribosomal protein L10